MAGWAQIGRYVREIDPYGRAVTIHPCNCGRDEVADESVLDFDMLQTGHGGPDSIPNMIQRVRASVAREPVKPVVDGEGNYEGILHGTGAEIQRLAFWACMLSGAAGRTYGANGIWQMNRPERPFGPSPHGGNWGDTPWREACRLEGSRQVGLGKGLLERFQWWRFESYPEWVIPAAGADNWFGHHAAGIPGEVRVIYMYNSPFPWAPKPNRVLALEAGVSYRASWFDPRTGDERGIGPVAADRAGEWTIPVAPTMQDWVLLLQRQ
jgi:hypothetical protein